MNKKHECAIFLPWDIFDICVSLMILTDIENIYTNTNVPDFNQTYKGVTT